MKNSSFAVGDVPEVYFTNGLEIAIDEYKRGKYVLFMGEVELIKNNSKMIVKSDKGIDFEYILNLYSQGWRQVI